MSLNRPDGDTGPEPFVRQKPQKRRRPVEPEAFVNPPRPRGDGGLGCALGGIVFLVVVGLVALGTFLPPISIGDRLFGTPYAPLNAQSAAVTQGDLTISVDPASPGSGLGVRVKVFSSQTLQALAAYNGDDKDWLRASTRALPTASLRYAALYRLQKQGTAPDQLTVAVKIPDGGNATDYDLYQYMDGHWQFLPAHPGPEGTSLAAKVKTLPEAVALLSLDRQVPVIGSVVEVGQQLSPKMAGLANLVYPAGLQPTLSGTLQGVLPAGVETGKGYAVAPVIRNFANPSAIDVATVTEVLQNSGLRAAHVDRLVEFASSKPYQGLAIDYRRLNADQRDNFTAFITTLAPKLRNANRTLTVVVPFPSQEGGSFATGAYDWRQLGSAVDTLQILMPVDPQAFAEKGLVDSGLQWTLGEVNRARLQIGLSTLSVQQTGNAFAPVDYASVLSPLGQIAVRPSVVPAGSTMQASLTGYAAQFAPLDSSGMPQLKYFAAGGTLTSTMWLATGPAVRKRLDRAVLYNLAGVVVTDALAAGVSPEVPNVLAMYKVNQPAEGQPVALGLRWTVIAQGTVVAQSTAAPGTPFAYQAPAGIVNGNLVVSAEILGARLNLPPVQVQIIAAPPTAAPTPPVAPTALAPVATAAAAG